MAQPSRSLLWILLAVGIVLNIQDANTAEEVKNLSNRKLQVIPQCEKNCTVTTLILNGNQISLKESDQLHLVSYSALTQLYLDNNTVMEIKAKYFSGMPRLKVLSLSANKISSLDPEAFTGLEALTELDLANNSLSSVPKQLLNTLKNLEVMNVDGNPWNCSCELLSIASNASCAAPQNMLGLSLNEALAKCSTTTTKPPSPTTPPRLKSAPTPQLNKSLEKDQPATHGNSWKFTISVVALGLTTATLILCAIKGPSWYRLFHNYRHRRLQDATPEPTGTTVFHQTSRQQQTYNFEEEGGRRRRTGDEEDDEDGYFEDPYIRREE
ncbi:leucine-rich repeat-containing protein 19-like isoform X2 [Boleophthalmus pectinirostris]|uniref:leucine-rich repeat-containing protein 19-like isoform X2 n=1 Tax=Boleophthalmus pectinirostris TaxID=150288 RepID=UPI002432AE09|nr:leucine-rich repeat-containing protein 19-like isoform X2 [Boleophthalmus pectinirostris]